MAFYSTRSKLHYLFIALAMLPLGTYSFSLSNWLKADSGVSVPADHTHLQEKEAVWSKFLGYGLQQHTSRLCGVTDNKNALIVKREKQLLALDDESGDVHWETSFNRKLSNLATIHKKRVFIATDEPRLFALDTDTGNPVWSASLPHTVLAKVAVNDQQVVVKTTAGEVIAFNLNNGKQLWCYHHPLDSIVMLNRSSTPVFYANMIITGFPNGKIIALDRFKGTLIWEHTVSTRIKGLSEIDQLKDIATDPVISPQQGSVYVSAYHGMLECLSLSTGALKWQKAFSSYMPLAMSQYLYGIDENQVIYAFNKENGETVWQQNAFMQHKTTNTTYDIVGPAWVSATKQLVVGDQTGNLYWIDSNTGKIVSKASFRVASSIFDVPITYKNKVYVINRRSQCAVWESPSV